MTPLMFRIINILFLISLLLFIFSCSRSGLHLPRTCEQLVIVTTQNAGDTRGLLHTYEKVRDRENWYLVSGPVPVVIGRNGLARGHGLIDIDIPDLPLKKEGDGRSPAGIFTFGHVFGYAPAEQFKELKMPYLQITDVIECIDDSQSGYYNQLIDTGELDEKDWGSSEKMIRYSGWYDQGIFINNNVDPIVAENGSCIFYHNWVSPDEVTAGCTAMDPAALLNLIKWIDFKRDPLCIQLPIEAYRAAFDEFTMPSL